VSRTSAPPPEPPSASASNTAIGNGGASQNEALADEVLVVFNGGITRSRQNAVASAHGLVELDRFDGLSAVRYWIKPAGSTLTAASKIRNLATAAEGTSQFRAIEAKASEVAKDAGVRYSEPMWVGHPAFLPNDPDYMPYQSAYLSKIRAPAAWDVTTGDPSAVVAIVDSGVNYTHPDLAGRIEPGGMDLIVPAANGDGSATPGDNIDHDGDGIPNAGVPHGTRVAGIVAAQTNNGAGVAGMDWACKILSLRIGPATGDGGPWLAFDAAKAFAAACHHSGVKVINLSGVFPSSATILYDAVADAIAHDILVVAAAGNNNTNDTVNYPTAPASFPNVCGAAATDVNDVKASFSNYGNWVSACAPGVGIFSTSYDGFVSGYSGSLNGTSYSAPMVSGEAMLIRALHPSYSAAQVRYVIKSTASNIDAENPTYAGQLGGRIDAAAAVGSADTYPLRLEYAAANSEYEVDLFFSRPLDLASAVDRSHYGISNGVIVQGASLLASGDAVRLSTTWAGSPLANYTVAVSGVKGSGGEELSLSGNTATYPGYWEDRNYCSTDSGGSAVASSAFDTAHVAGKAIDENISTYWAAEIIGKVPVVLTVDFGRVAAISEIVVTPWIYTSHPYSMTFSADYAVVNVDQDYEQLVPSETIGSSGEHFDDFQPVFARYLRFTFTDATGLDVDSDSIANAVEVAEVKAYRRLTQWDFTPPTISILSAPSAPLGAPVTASGQHFGETRSTSYVLVGDVDAPIVSWSDTEITFIVPFNPLNMPIGLPMQSSQPPAPGEPATGTVANKPPDYGAALPPTGTNARSGNVYVVVQGVRSNGKYLIVTP
jgi:thermitase